MVHLLNVTSPNSIWICCWMWHSRLNITKPVTVQWDSQESRVLHLPYVGRPEWAPHARNPLWQRGQVGAGETWLLFVRLVTATIGVSVCTQERLSHRGQLPIGLVQRTVRRQTGHHCQWDNISTESFMNLLIVLSQTAGMQLVVKPFRWLIHGFSEYFLYAGPVWKYLSCSRHSCFSFSTTFPYVRFHGYSQGLS